MLRDDEVTELVDEDQRCRASGRGRTRASRTRSCRCLPTQVVSSALGSRAQASAVHRPIAQIGAALPHPRAPDVRLEDRGTGSSPRSPGTESGRRGTPPRQTLVGGIQHGRSGLVGAKRGVREIERTGSARVSGASKSRRSEAVRSSGAIEHAGASNSGRRSGHVRAPPRWERFMSGTPELCEHRTILDISIQRMDDRIADAPPRRADPPAHRRANALR